MVDGGNPMAWRPVGDVGGSGELEEVPSWLVGHILDLCRDDINSRLLAHWLCVRQAVRANSRVIITALWLAANVKMTSNMSPKTARAIGTGACLRSALVCCWPAMCVAVLLLLPFLNTPFTIDDPIYLREAQHVLTDPLHPQAFNIVWSTDFNLRASEDSSGRYRSFLIFLYPPCWQTRPSGVGHLTQLLFLLAAIVATALTASRLGLSARQARWSAILTATCPAVLPMAATVMPDIAAMLFSILGMERIITWRDGRKWHQAGLAIFWLDARGADSFPHGADPGACRYLPFGWNHRGRRSGRHSAIFRRDSCPLSWFRSRF